MPGVVCKGGCGHGGSLLMRVEWVMQPEDSLSYL
jgi:hypothetical protein